MKNLTIRFLILFTLMAAPALVSANTETAEEINMQKAVLITGASTGIGRNITERLASEGYLVYAGARKQSDLNALNAIENVQSVKLDVTVQEEIDAAVETVKAGGIGLYAVINNAGVNVVGPLIELEESQLDFLFDVNMYGPYRITRAFAPMVIEAKGRIVNISSISGILSGGGYGIYSMSKHAIEAYTDSLAMELAPFGVKVSAIEPGNYNSKIGDTRCARLLASGYDPTNSRYKERMQQIIDDCKIRNRDGDNSTPEPDAVAEAALHAISDDNPKEHYLVVPNQKEAEWTIRKAIEEVVSLNRDQAFSFSRDELIKMLDEQIAYKGQ